MADNIHGAGHRQQKNRSEQKKGDACAALWHRLSFSANVKTVVLAALQRICYVVMQLFGGYPALERSSDFSAHLHAPRKPSSPRSALWKGTLTVALCGVVVMGAAVMLERSSARAVESGPLFAQEMRQANGLMVLVSPQPVLPTFTATIHYQVGSAHEWQGLYGVAEVLGELILDSQPGTRDPAAEGVLLGQLAQLDLELRRKRQLLQITPPREAIVLQASVSALETQLTALQQQLAINSFFRISELLYLERGGIGPTVKVSPTEVQLSVTLPSDQLSFFMGMERMRMLSFSPRSFYGVREKLAERRTREQLEPGNRLLRTTLSAAYQVHPYGRYQADAASVRGIAIEEVEQFYRQFLSPAQTVISIVGGVRADEVRALAAQYWGDVPKGREPELLEPLEPPQSGLRRVEVVADAPSEVLMVFPRSVADAESSGMLMPLLAELLADPRAGVLASLHASGMAEDVVAMQYPPAPPLGTRHPDLLVVGARATGRTTVEELETQLREILRTLATTGPEPAVFEGARRRLLTRLGHHFTDPTLAAPMLARAFATFGEVDVLNRLYHKLETVTSAEVQALATVLFADKNTTIGSLHPAIIRTEGHSDEAQADAHDGADEADKAAEKAPEKPETAAGHSESAEKKEGAAPPAAEPAKAEAPVEAPPIEAPPIEAPAAPAAAPAEGGH